ncbi:hypothetical protein P280DRAFT_286101 [Massarina eburnea CBS 473.64]|uniref:Uncharacterized protein n=1 Tax=Massarina eburnea CBS 473.64 TaxID=1395130 RepID=A0A6A6S1T0_9PLEO|nr:hypothetical protein P280DRAFT_286101 [Massarina eburnea CBS 473.64]
MPSFPTCIYGSPSELGQSRAYIPQPFMNTFTAKPSRAARYASATPLAKANRGVWVVGMAKSTGSSAVIGIFLPCVTGPCTTSLSVAPLGLVSTAQSISRMRRHRKSITAGFVYGPCPEHPWPSYPAIVLERRTACLLRSR